MEVLFPPRSIWNAVLPVLTPSASFLILKLSFASLGESHFVLSVITVLITVLHVFSKLWLPLWISDFSFFFFRRGTVFHYVLYRLENSRSPKDLIPEKNAAKFFAGGPALISVFSLGFHSLLQFQLLELSEGIPGVSWLQENGDERRGKDESELESLKKLYKRNRRR